LEKGGLLMAHCEIPGCNCKATKVVSGEGVYYGVCVDWKLECCPFHSKREIERAADAKAEKEAEGMQICNPFMGVKCELGKAAY
jgi:hypothetical protein